MRSRKTSRQKTICSIVTIILFNLIFPQHLSAEPNTTNVEVVPLEQLLFYPSREAPATAVNLNNSQISAEISGEIINIPIQIGDEITKDTVLANIDCESYKIAKQRANAALRAGLARNKYASKRLEDAKFLNKSRTISKDELNLRDSEAGALAADVGVLNAELKEAARRISKCVVKAPFDAVVIDRMASVGDYASPGSALVRLLDLNNIEVSAKIQQQDTASLETAGSISFITSGKNYPVTLRTIVPLVDSRIRSFESRLIFSEDIAPSGSAGRLRWESDQVHIPADFLVEREGLLGVFVYEGNSAHFHPLDNVGNGLPAPIKLPLNTQIITTGRYGLIDKQAIQVIEP